MFDVADYDNATATFRMSSGGQQTGQSGSCGINRNHYYVENVEEELDSPGEYFARVATSNSNSSSSSNSNSNSSSAKTSATGKSRSAVFVSGANLSGTNAASTAGSASDPVESAEYTVTLRFVPPINTTLAQLNSAVFELPVHPRVVQLRGATSALKTAKPTVTAASAATTTSTTAGGTKPTSATASMAANLEEEEEEVVVDEVTHHIRFDGLRFAGSAPTFMADWEMPSGGDWTVHRGGMLFMDGVENISVVGCTFDHAGGNALFLSRHAWHTEIVGNVFSHTGDTAIALVGSTDLMDGTGDTFVAHTHLQNNLIHEVSGVY
jgi:hypothetical protein